MEIFDDVFNCLLASICRSFLLDEVEVVEDEVVVWSIDGGGCGGWVDESVEEDDPVKLMIFCNRVVDSESEEVDEGDAACSYKGDLVGEVEEKTAFVVEV